jgi:hypothetical protein
MLKDRKERDIASAIAYLGPASGCVARPWQSSSRVQYGCI